MSLWPGERAAHPVQLVKGVQAVIALGPNPVQRHLQKATALTLTRVPLALLELNALMSPLGYERQ